MDVICQVLNVKPNFDQQSKIKAKVEMLAKNPLQAIEVTLFEHHTKSGLLTRFESLQNQQCVVQLEINEYRGRVQYQLPYECRPYKLQELVDSISTKTENAPPLKTAESKANAK